MQVSQEEDIDEISPIEKLCDRKGRGKTYFSYGNLFVYFFSNSAYSAIPGFSATYVEGELKVIVFVYRSIRINRDDDC